MKKIFRYIFLPIIISLFLVPIASAKVSVGEKIISVDKDEVVSEDLFISAEEVNIYGTVYGDVYAAGGRVVIEGIITGDLYVAGGQVLLSGVVEQDVHMAGGNLSVDAADIGGSLVVLGGDVHVDSSSRINESVVFVTGVFDLAAHVGEGLTGLAGMLNLSGSVEKDVYVGVDDFRIQSTAVVNDNVTYFSDKDAEVFDGAVVLGGLQRMMHEFNIDGSKFNFYTMKAWLYLWSFIAFFVLGALIIYFFPKQVSNVNKIIYKTPGRSLLYGILSFLIVPFVLLILMITGIGLPLAFVFGLLFIIQICVTKVFVAALFGDNIAGWMKWKKPNPYWVYALGLLVFCLLRMLPIIGGFVVLVSYVFVFGALILTELDLLERFRKGKIS